KGCLMATKSDTEITLADALGIKNIFVNDWKLNFFADKKKRIASNPFMRNLIEYTHGRTDADFMRLTSLLHWKPDSAAITQADLDGTYNKLFGTAESYKGNAGVSAVDMIQ